MEAYDLGHITVSFGHPTDLPSAADLCTGSGMAAAIVLVYDSRIDKHEVYGHMHGAHSLIPSITVRIEYTKQVD